MSPTVAAARMISCRDSPACAGHLLGSARRPANYAVQLLHETIEGQADRSYLIFRAGNDLDREIAFLFGLADSLGRMP
jgi:hypothetical protein